MLTFKIGMESWPSWCCATSAVSTGAAGGAAPGQFYGHSAFPGRRVEWQWESMDGKSGTVVINGVTDGEKYDEKFDRCEGGLFFGHTEGDELRVVQRKRKLERASV